MVLFDTVTKRYKEDITALEDVNFNIEEGEFCFVVGPSGAGKSTIMRLLIREEIPTSGSIFFRDIEVPKLTRRLLPAYRQKLGVVFQDIKLLQSKTLEENIAFALEILDKSPKEIVDTTDYLLDLVGLRERRTLFPDELSGGEQQRGAIARALANKPDLFIADEPTGNLDQQNAEQILEILKTINATGTTVMVISHDFHLVNGSKARTIKIVNGRLEEDSGKSIGPKKEVKEKEVVKEEKKEKKEVHPEFNSLSDTLKEKFLKFAINSPEILLNITAGDLKNMNLSKEEHKELETFVKNYLSKNTKNA
ncbi:cell division ATP-binding protein FtsE [Candidatus Dojkabacteria bacterium HGW-Dojkabacteria-1]|uniref:Cell division ATP-binding protein FtsE n=1 Tax=Candidatus Dojkabacteria bacterium HGW-Dojkabacteria-1 TaxID=2013761 RepID=A0A2N2F3G3_9BACT|nr:MAG: cell division ATP-binding protein FtsE [Candidatus Dojkabacteria bacterium HGW-Dojkabacteria-1]